MKKYTDQMVEQVSKAPEQAGGHKDKPQVGTLKREFSLVKIEKYNDAKKFIYRICSCRREQKIYKEHDDFHQCKGSGGFGGKACVWLFRILPDWDKAKEDKRYDVKSRTGIYGGCYQILQKSYLLFA